MIDLSCNAGCEASPVNTVIGEVMLDDVGNDRSQFAQYEFAQSELAHGFRQARRQAQIGSVSSMTF